MVISSRPNLIQTFSYSTFPVRCGYRTDHVGNWFKTCSNRISAANWVRVLSLSSNEKKAVTRSCEKSPTMFLTYTSTVPSQVPHIHASSILGRSASKPQPACSASPLTGGGGDYTLYLRKCFLCSGNKIEILGGRQL